MTVRQNPSLDELLQCAVVLASEDLIPGETGIGAH